MSHGDCKVNTKGSSVSNVSLQLCVCYVRGIHEYVYLCRLYLLEGVEKMKFSLVQNLIKKSCPKNISSGSKGKTCFMEQLRKRHVCDLEEFISILLPDIACMFCFIF